MTTRRRRPSGTSAGYVLLGVAALLMPVAALVGDAVQWILIAGAVVVLVLGAYAINGDHRRSGRS